jgi:hypothetical protein
MGIGSRTREFDEDEGGALLKEHRDSGRRNEETREANFTSTPFSKYAYLRFLGGALTLRLRKFRVPTFSLSC